MITIVLRHIILYNCKHTNRFYKKLNLNSDTWTKQNVQVSINRVYDIQLYLKHHCNLVYTLSHQNTDSIKKKNSH